MYLCNYHSIGDMTVCKSLIQPLKTLDSLNVVHIKHFCSDFTEFLLI